jgi:2-methylisocitrate lyase-like PEP mutase family enzyme
MGFSEFARVVSTMRKANKAQLNGLALEVVLHCAEQERTMAQLEQLTGSSHGRLTEAVRTVTAYFDSGADELRVPALQLLIRRKVKGARAYKYSLSEQGRQLLQGVSP